jgi:hypothetical protein
MIPSARLAMFCGAAWCLCLPCAGHHIGSDPKAERERQWRDQLTAIARDYELAGRVDDLFRWAPEMCRMPGPPKARMSASEDEKTHGKKLYSLFAKDRHAYTRTHKHRELKSAPIGQWIVKESWTPEEFAGDETEMKPITRQLKSKDENQGKINDVFLPFAKNGDKSYRAKEKSGLFVMMKLDPATPDTDQGWIYATVAKDMKTITALGKIESCMKCHADAKWDRQFGLKIDN